MDIVPAARILLLSLKAPTSAATIFHAENPGGWYLVSAVQS
jgi:hypothetical protein